MSEANDLRFADQKIIDVDLEKEMKKSYIDYAMSVIVSRALLSSASRFTTYLCIQAGASPHSVRHV